MVADRYHYLQVYVNICAERNEKQKIEDKLNEILRSANIMFEIQYIEKDFSDLSISAGSIAETRVERGTLGGFARSYNTESGAKERLVGLVSQHVAVTDKTDMTLGYRPYIIGTIINPHPNDFDIAAVSIRPNDEHLVETRMRDVLDRLKFCELFTYKDYPNLNLQRFELVFIRGAKTLLGHGEIRSVALKHATPHLIICSRNDKPGSLFCQKGDSGALVCRADRKGSLFALAILKGEISPKQRPPLYSALMLEEGLLKLEKAHNKKYKFCDETEQPHRSV